MHYDNALEPSKEQLDATLGGADDGPIYMLNLLKFRDRAQYADGRDSELSGRDAYALYGAGVVETLAEVGGSIVFAGHVTGLLLGEVEDLWDDVAIAMYPSRAAMLQMMASEKYQAIHVHREAGLAGQLNIQTQAAGAFA
ncbi:MAG: DUF1330 domain-containing protein [Halioglobus sp.]|nr:DUF1330 domain-containing protein [Halioglobus sp.]|tara:strand:- start:1118 stop:1537 length:420 start_codon:yes stop_codon:yes gene_type:complete